MPSRRSRRRPTRADRARRPTRHRPATMIASRSSMARPSQHPLSAYSTAARRPATSDPLQPKPTPARRSRHCRLIAKTSIRSVYANGPRVLPAAALAAKSLVFHSDSLLNASVPENPRARILRLRAATVIASSRFVAEPLARHLSAPNPRHLQRRPTAARP